MDQPTMMSENAFQSGDTASCNLSEIWPFSISGGGGESCGVGDGGGGLKLRRLQFGSSLSQFGEANVNRDVCGKDEVGVELRGGGHGIGDGRKRREAVAAEDEAAKGVSTSGDGNGMDNDSDGKRVRASGFRDDNHNFKAEDEGNAAKGVEQNNKPEPRRIIFMSEHEEAKPLIATALQKGREKISERMRILQDLVPGCNKVIGKALVLDEIINYIQSLQRQVEFLSMKLEAVNSRTNIGIEGYPSKDFGQQVFDTSGVRYGSQAPQDHGRSSSPEWLHMQIGGGFERQT
ncbi:hypothetical protein Dimus_031381 [Dionaea muscipula]